MLITNQSRRLKDEFNGAITGCKEIWIATAYASRMGCEALNLEHHASAAVAVRVVIGRAMIEGLPQSTIDYLVRDLAPKCAATGGGIRIATAAIPFHSKLYVLTFSSGLRIWLGSSNLSDNGLAMWTEASAEIKEHNLKRDVFKEVKRLWDAAKPIEEIGSLIPVKLPGRRRLPTNGVPNGGTRPDASESESEIDRPGILLSLINSTGIVSEHDGLNWGNGLRGKKPRDPDDVCFAVSQSALSDFSKLLGGVNHGDTFSATMHDGTRMLLKLQGGNKAKNKPKNLSTNPNSILGKWILRDILKIPAGTVVTKEMLEAYGRTHVGIYRDGADPTGKPTLYVDFSVPKPF